MDDMTERKGLTKKIRFEVFKRDSFTCQYCGKSAPSVVLEVDHIKPVSKDGDNEIINLITACKDCNAGKSDRELSDDTVMEKRKSQLDELQERREQIEMMMEWQVGLEGLKELEIKNIVSIVNAKIAPRSLNENGTAKIRICFPKYTYQEIYDSLQISASQYLEYDEYGKYFTQESVLKFLDYIPKIAKNRRLIAKKPYLGDLFRLRNYMKSKGFYVDYNTLDILEDAYKKGIYIDYLEAIIRQSGDYTEWLDTMTEIINDQQDV